MSAREAVQFWNTVGEPMQPDAVKAGDVFLLEDHSTPTRTSRLMRIVRVWNEDGQTKMQFELCTDPTAKPSYVIVADLPDE